MPFAGQALIPRGCVRPSLMLAALPAFSSCDPQSPPGLSLEWLPIHPDRWLAPDVVGGCRHHGYVSENPPSRGKQGADLDPGGARIPGGGEPRRRPVGARQPERQAGRPVSSHWSGTSACSSGTGSRACTGPTTCRPRAPRRRPAGRPGLHFVGIRAELSGPVKEIGPTRAPSDVPSRPGPDRTSAASASSRRSCARWHGAGREPRRPPAGAAAGESGAHPVRPGQLLVGHLDLGKLAHRAGNQVRPAGRAARAAWPGAPGRPAAADLEMIVWRWGVPGAHRATPASPTSRPPSTSPS